jgi:hypothetical protein
MNQNYNQPTISTDIDQRDAQGPHTCLALLTACWRFLKAGLDAFTRCLSARRTRQTSVFSRPISLPTSLERRLCQIGADFLDSIGLVAKDLCCSDPVASLGQLPSTSEARCKEN